MTVLDHPPVTYAVSTQVVTSQHLAIIHATATQASLPTQISQTLPRLWTFSLACGVQSTGYNVVVYPDLQDDRPGGIPIEVGIQILNRFNSQPPIFFSSTPAGTVATTTHMGAYEDLPNAHNALRAWCRANGQRLAGICWEVYGHWQDDPAQRRTDVFYLLR